jgi:hypothetical protein
MRGVAYAVLTCLVAAVVGGPSSATAAPLRLLLPRTGVFTTDGDRYAIFGAAFSPKVTVLDTRTGARRLVALPSGCSVLVNLNIRWPAAKRRAILTCNDGVQRLLDLRSATTQGLPAPGAPTAIGTRWTVLGAEWLGGEVLGGCAVPDRNGGCWQFRNVRTGAVRTTSVTYAPDPDDPALAQVPRCPGLRHAARVPLGAPTAGQRLYERRRALVLHGPDGRSDRGLTLARCGKRTLPLDRRVTHWERLAGGVASWTTGEDALLDPERDARPGTLAAYITRTGTLRRWRLPRATFRTDCENEPIRGTIGESLHTRDAVFWVVPTQWDTGSVCGVDAEAVYSAPLR